MFYFIFVFDLQDQSKNIYVSTDGNDSCPGMLDQPFKTIQKALDAAVETKVKGILIKKGGYQLIKPLTLLPSDSSGDSLKITNCSNDKVIIHFPEKILNRQRFLLL